MSSQYERELRAVLAGIPKGVDAVTRSCDPVTKAKAMQVIERPFLVVRAAGSGMEGSGDLLALRGDICFPIEVKSSKKPKLYLSGRTWEQYQSMIYEGKRCELMPLYAYRLKSVRGDSWRIFRVDVGRLSGRLGILTRRIPELPLTRNGKPFLDWEQGMPLHQFISLVCRKSTTSTLESLDNRIKNIDLSKEESNDESSQMRITDMVPR